MWTAWFLKEREPDLDVVILEADICGGGPSGRNGGFWTGWWAHLADLVAHVRRRGRDGAADDVRPLPRRDRRVVRGQRRRRVVPRGRRARRLDEPRPRRPLGGHVRAGAHGSAWRTSIDELTPGRGPRALRLAAVPRRLPRCATARRSTRRASPAGSGAPCWSAASGSTSAPRSPASGAAGPWSPRRRTAVVKAGHAVIALGAWATSWKAFRPEAHRPRLLHGRHRARAREARGAGLDGRRGRARPALLDALPAHDAGRADRVRPRRAAARSRAADRPPVRLHRTLRPARRRGPRPTCSRPRSTCAIEAAWGGPINVSGLTMPFFGSLGAGQRALRPGVHGQRRGADPPRRQDPRRARRSRPTTGSRGSRW